MGPRLQERGVVLLTSSKTILHFASMGPRLQERGVRRRRRRRKRRRRRFNGAALTRARSSFCGDSNGRAIGNASMGPRLQERGVFLLGSIICVPRDGFNGAALTRARSSRNNMSYHVTLIKLQWGRAYKSAELTDITQGGYRALNASMGPRLQERGVSFKLLKPAGKMNGFNGAALTRARSSQAVQALAVCASIASMGPRLQERGVRAKRSDREAQNPCFNGAALTRARSCPRSCPLVNRYQVLQWGRAYKSAELRILCL